MEESRCLTIKPSCQGSRVRTTATGRQPHVAERLYAFPALWLGRRPGPGRSFGGFGFVWLDHLDRLNLIAINTICEERTRTRNRSGKDSEFRACKRAKGTGLTKPIESDIRSLPAPERVVAHVGAVAGAARATDGAAAGQRGREEEDDALHGVPFSKES